MSDPPFGLAVPNDVDDNPIRRPLKNFNNRLHSRFQHLAASDTANVVAFHNEFHRNEVPPDRSDSGSTVRMQESDLKASAESIPMTPPRVLGIDPGLNITGYGVVEPAAGGPRLCEAGVVRGRDRGSLTARVLEIHQGVRELIDSLRPSVMAVEELYSHYARPRTAILMGHARGVICLAAAQAGIPVVHYAATRVKKVLTGSGRAPKSQMQRVVQEEFKLRQPLEPPDVADALAIALTHFYLQPDWVQLTQKKPSRGRAPAVD